MFGGAGNSEAARISEKDFYQSLISSEGVTDEQGMQNLPSPNKILLQTRLSDTTIRCADGSVPKVEILKNLN
jgi:hypothetical protein